MIELTVWYFLHGVATTWVPQIVCGGLGHLGATGFTDCPWRETETQLPHPHHSGGRWVMSHQRPMGRTLPPMDTFAEEMKEVNQWASAIFKNLPESPLTASLCPMASSAMEPE